jgi:cytochrome P450
MPDPAESTVDSPYPRYRALREDGAGQHRSYLGLTTFYRYQDCAAILRDPRWGKGEGMRKSEQNGSRLRNSFMRQDPPEHTRLRRLVAKAFSASVVEGLRARIQGIADDLIDRMPADAEVDLMAGYAYSLPVTVICELLGVPVADRELFGAWTEALARGEDPDTELTAAERAQRRQASVDFRRYFARLAGRRRRHPGDDLLSRLIEIRDDGDRLDDADLQATCVLLLFAGHETTVNLIGNGTYALLRHPPQLAMVRSGRVDGTGWVHELLRYDPPIQMVSRAALTDVSYGGRDYAKGESVLLMLGSANHDPEVFADPQRLDLTRPNVRHLAFGLGIHFCLGAALAQLEGEIAVGTLLRRIPGLAVAGDGPRYKTNIAMRGLRELPVHATGKS